MKKLELNQEIDGVIDTIMVTVKELYGDDADSPLVRAWARAALFAIMLNQQVLQ